MLDHPDADDGFAPSPDRLHGNYPPQFEPPNPSTGEYYHPSMSASAPVSHPPHTDGEFAAIGEMIDADDPMLDADPFGLSASMHYPTAYAFEQPQQR